MKERMDLITELELLDRIKHGSYIEDDERQHLAQVVFENNILANNPIICRMAAIERLAQVRTGSFEPRNPTIMTLSLGSEYELRVEIPPRSRCKSNP